VEALADDRVRDPSPPPQRRPLTSPSIGGGGYVPARILRSFLKTPGSANIPIQAIGLSLYEKLHGDDGPEEAAGHTVTRTQWLDFSAVTARDLVGRNILIVDEVDDTRTTLQYAVQELKKDVEEAARKLGRQGEETKFFIFVLHVSMHGGEGGRGASWRGQADGSRTRTSRRRESSLRT
jgi:hypothetical protein